ncbi:MAG: hypothetical protein P8Y28_02985 [Gammaproteobacteria bacterium]|jgi:hypothetical protein
MSVDAYQIIDDRILKAIERENKVISHPVENVAEPVVARLPNPDWK